MLIDEIEKLKKEIAEREEEEKKVIEEVEEKAEEPEEEEIEEEKAEPEKEKKEEKKEEEKKEEELDNAGYARLRREAAAEKKRREELEKQIEELKGKKEEVKTEEVVLPPELQSVVADHRVRGAEREFMTFESKVRTSHKDYDAVTAEYGAAMYQSIKLQNPRKSDVELTEMTKFALLNKAAEFARAGYENPVEELYYEAKELGFKGIKPEPKDEGKEEVIQPDLKKVAENRKRSTGMATNNGRSEGLMTLSAAADLTTVEWAKLPAAEKQRLLYGR